MYKESPDHFIHRLLKAEDAKEKGVSIKKFTLNPSKNTDKYLGSAANPKDRANYLEGLRIVSQPGALFGPEK